MNDRRAETVRVEQEANELDARIAALAPFGSFKQIVQTRYLSVTALAQARIDWERLSRELAHVLPSRAYLTELNATTGLQTGTGSSTTSGSTASEPAGPSVELAGCADDQPVVARMLVSLRRLHRATDVELLESAKVTAGEQGASSSSSSSGGGEAACLKGYAFQARVTLEATATVPEGGGYLRRVPASLGGGS